MSQGAFFIPKEPEIPFFAQAAKIILSKDPLKGLEGPKGPHGGLIDRALQDSLGPFRACKCSRAFSSYAMLPKRARMHMLPLQASGPAR